MPLPWATCCSRPLRASVRASVTGAHRTLTRVAQSVAVIGLGRVGLPLALSFADRGLEVIGVEKRQEVLDSLDAGKMPFEEPGAQELLERVSFERSQKIQDAAAAEQIVLTLGTPTYIHIEIEISQIREAIDDLLPVLREGHSIVLRSTVAPGTTDWVAGYVEQRRGFRAGEDLFVSHVPERIAEGRFFEEIGSAAGHRRRRRRRLGRQGGRAVRGLRHRDPADHPGAGRAGQDLVQHPALHGVRPAESPDDELPRTSERTCSR